MIYVDVKRSKTIEFDIENADLVESVQMVVQLPDKRVLNFPGSIINLDKNNNGTLLVEVPILDKEVPSDITADCYMELKDKSGAYYKLEQTQVTFQSERVISLQFHEVQAERKPELTSRKKDAILGPGVVTIPKLQRHPRKIMPRTKVIEGDFLDTGSDN